MAVTNGYPTGNVGRAYQAPAAVSDHTALASLAAYNNQELELTYVSPTGEAVTKIITTLVALGKQLAGGQFGDVKLAEMQTENYPEFKFLEKDAKNRVYTVAKAVTDGTTTSVEVTNATGIQRGDLFRVPKSSEIMRVSAVNGNVLTVVRGTADNNGWAGQAIAQDDKIIMMGNAVAGGEAGRVAFSTAALMRSNYIQKIITTVEVTDEDVFSGKYGKDKATALKAFMQEKLVEHYDEIEHASMLGQKKTGVDPVSGKNWYTTEGLLNTALRGIVGDLSGGLTIGTLNAAIGQTVPYGKSTKVIFCGADAYWPIQSLFTGMIRVDSIKDVNLEFQSITLNGGKFIITTHPLLNADYGLSKYAVVCDPSTFVPVFPNGIEMGGKKKSGKTTFYQIPALSTHSKEVGEYVTYIGFKNSNALASGVFKIAA